MFMKKKFLAVTSFLLPSKVAVFFLRICGYNVSYRSSIGFSLLYLDSMNISDGSSIGHFNVIKCIDLTMSKDAKIGHINVIRGPFNVVMNSLSCIGNSNRIKRAPFGVTTGESILSLGHLTKITGNHLLDLTKSIKFGDFSILAGSDSQLWTHGYYHYPSGPERFRIDGEIEIQNNVYIGSRVVINAGVKISDSISIGSNSCVSKSVQEPGMYVSQSLRFMKVDLNQTKEKLSLDETNSCEVVYIKAVN